MGFWDVVTGRTRPKQANLDSLFLVPSAAITLETTIGLRPTGEGSVCYRAATGAAFQQTQDDVVALLDADPDAPAVEVSRDEYGFTWLLNRHDPEDVSGLVTDLHAVNTSLEAQGFGPGLLCSLVPFGDASGRRVGLVYLYKQASFYPFAPAAGKARQRDNLLEIEVRDALTGELPIEKDLSRWLAVWGAPGL
jgi:PspAB-like protein